MDFDVCKSCYKKRRPYEDKINQARSDMIHIQNKTIDEWRTHEHRGGF